MKKTVLAALSLFVFGEARADQISEAIANQAIEYAQAGRMADWQQYAKMMMTLDQGSAFHRAVWATNRAIIGSLSDDGLIAVRPVLNGGSLDRPFIAIAIVRQATADAKSPPDIDMQTLLRGIIRALELYKQSPTGDSYAPHDAQAGDHEVLGQTLSIAEVWIDLRAGAAPILLGLHDVQRAFAAPAAGPRTCVAL